MALSIKARNTDTIIARGEPGQTARKFEGNWYFDPGAVDMQHLKVTERIYTCPYKGRANWIDLETPDGKVYKNVAWVYRDPKSGYEFIKDHIAFYARDTGGTVAENSDPEPSPLQPLISLVKKILPL